MRRLLIAAAKVAVCVILMEFATAAQVQLSQDFGSISGKIVAKDGTPAVGVRVAAMDAQDNPTAREASLLSVVETDSQGQYRLERVPVGRYYITAGFLDTPTFFPGVSAQTQATVVEVTRSASLTGKDFTIVFPTAVTVRGAVIRDDGAVPNSRNDVRFTARSGGSNSAPVSPDGSFQINLRPGIYDINAGSPFVYPATLSVLDHDIPDLRLEVPAVTPLSGTVAVEKKFPVPQFELTFTSIKNGTPYLARPSGNPLGVPQDDGTPFYLQLPRGDYRVTADGLPNGYFLRTMTADSRDIIGDILTVTTVAPKVAVVLGTESLPAMPRVGGRVLGGALTVEGNPDRRPLSVQLSGPATWGGLNAAVTPDGTFEFPGVLPGTYRMGLARQNPNVPDVTVIVADRDLSLVIPTTIVKSIQGKVTIEGGGPAPRFGLVYRTARAFESSVALSSNSSVLIPGADGSFMVALPEGEYEVGISSTTPIGYAVRSFTYGTTDLLNNKIVVDENSATFQLVMATSGALNLLEPPNSARSIPTLPPLTYLVREEYPSILTRVDAQYTDEARRNRIQGGVILEVLVHSDGSADPAIKVIRPIGFGLDAQAIDAARKWKFTPAIKNGTPVEGKLQIEIIFRL